MDLTGLPTLADVEAAARGLLDDAAWAYLAGGAGTDGTVRANVAAFDGLSLVPRVFRTTAATLDTAVSLFGQQLSMPVLLAPTSPQRLFHPDAELATARAAAAAGTVSVVSTDGHYPVPEVAAAAGKHWWFQLYPYGSPADVEATLALAQDAGAGAVVVTADATHRARRIGTWRAGFRTPPHVDFGTLRQLGILDGDAPADARLDRTPLGWDDLAWIRRRTSVPLLVKGVLHADDAKRCIAAGADGVIVSNHGGRQLDSVVPSLVALERVVAAVADSGAAILVDGGVRSGVDVVKALALGAHAVCVGRPYLWGLSLNGEAGVSAVLAILRVELEDALRQLGLAGIDHLATDSVLRRGA
jgi:4-hydroxymandelate oxidase